jgi:hypothetical protein
METVEGLLPFRHVDQKLEKGKIKEKRNKIC